MRFQISIIKLDGIVHRRNRKTMNLRHILSLSLSLAFGRTMKHSSIHLRAPFDSKMSSDIFKIFQNQERKFEFEEYIFRNIPSFSIQIIRFNQKTRLFPFSFLPSIFLRPRLEPNFKHGRDLEEFPKSIFLRAKMSSKISLPAGYSPGQDETSLERS